MNTVNGPGSAGLFSRDTFVRDSYLFVFMDCNFNFIVHVAAEFF